jgi:chromosome segregation ATPase
VAPDYEKAKAVIAEISSLSQQILDARLALTRSKQRHPEPRLTVSSASAQLDSQIMKMQESADELQRLNAKVSAAKDDVKAKSKQLEALRSQRGEVEKIRSSKVDEVEDPRYAGLYDWYDEFPSPVVVRILPSV